MTAADHLNISLEVLKTFARITGHRDVHDLSADDLYTCGREISEFANIPTHESAPKQRGPLPRPAEGR